MLFGHTAPATGRALPPEDLDPRLDAPRDGEKWDEPWFTAVGFPRVFYLRYHGYSAYFPTWALGRYEKLMKGNSRKVQWGL